MTEQSADSQTTNHTSEASQSTEALPAQQEPQTDSEVSGEQVAAPAVAEVEPVPVPIQPVTAEHQAFLKSRGYDFDTIEKASAFVGRMDAKGQQSFFADFANPSADAPEVCSNPIVTNGVAGSCGLEPGHEPPCKAA
jgi:hypothetical protein